MKNILSNNEKLIVSVIMPAFNAAAFIEKSLESIINQNFRRTFEILVIDDNSTDRTAAIVKNMGCQYTSIRLIKNSRSKGPSGARNEGLLAARGQYIAFLDADDEFLPDHLLSGVAFLDGNLSIDMVMFNFDVVFYKNKVRRGDWTSEKNHMRGLPNKDLGNGFMHVQAPLMPALLQESFLHLQATMVRKDFIDGFLFNELLNRAEDRDIAVRLDYKKNMQFAYSPKITGIYYLHESSLTSPSLDNSIATIENGIAAFKEYFSWNEIPEKTRQLLKNLLHERYLNLAYLHRQKGEQKNAFRNIHKANKIKFSLKVVKEFLKTVAYIPFSILK